MVFSSLPFLFVFLPLFLVFYVLVPARNLVALLFSLVFYAWGEGVYVLLLMAVTLVNYGFGRAFLAQPGNRWLVGVAVAINVGILVWFKYAGFLLLDVLGLPIDEEGLPSLPLGISFFIFQSISYLVDSWKRPESTSRSLADLALYICMFPQLIAGPIVRYASVADALRERRITANSVRRGLILFLLGLSQKLLLANNVGLVADQVFALPPGDLNPQSAWLGAVAYGLQIFHDFAGYSLMAIGLGAIMGFTFPQNFNYPYISRSMTEFWRRWHMSLSSWFRDYLYIPLGGNRKGRWRTVFNLYLVFFLCGLWHGAAWNFVIWGLFHGTVLMMERLGWGRALERMPAPFPWVMTLFLVLIGWVLFRAESLPAALAMIATMLGMGASGPTAMAELLSNETLLFGLAAVVFCAPVARWLSAALWTVDGPRPPRAVRMAGGMAVAILVFLNLVYVYAGPFNPFIYFRF